MRQNHPEVRAQQVGHGSDRATRGLQFLLSLVVDDKDGPHRHDRNHFGDKPALARILHVHGIGGEVEIAGPTDGAQGREQLTRAAVGWLDCHAVSSRVFLDNLRNRLLQARGAVETQTLAAGNTGPVPRTPDQDAKPDNREQRRAGNSPRAAQETEMTACAFHAGTSTSGAA